MNNKTMQVVPPLTVKELKLPRPFPPGVRYPAVKPDTGKGPVAFQNLTSQERWDIIGELKDIAYSTKNQAMMNEVHEAQKSDAVNDIDRYATAVMRALAKMSLQWVLWRLMGTRWSRKRRPHYYPHLTDEQARDIRERHIRGEDVDLERYGFDYTDSGCGAFSAELGYELGPYEVLPPGFRVRRDRRNLTAPSPWDTREER